jgi:hypothetical protein
MPSLTFPIINKWNINHLYCFWSPA